MSRTIYFTASSLDGFIADPDHSLSWLFVQDIDEEGPMSPTSLMEGIGAMAMGASTYQWLLDHMAATGEPWVYDIPCWVFTHRSFDGIDGADVRFTSGDVEAVHAEMVAAANGRDIWVVGGGDLVGQFADVGLLDEVAISYAPVTLGAGAPLLPRRLDMDLLEVDRNRDFTCARFSVNGPLAAG